MAGIDGKVKAAFTRAYNKEGLMTPYAAVGGGVKTSRARGAAKNSSTGDEMDEADDDTSDAMIKIKKTVKKTTVKKETVKKETVKKETVKKEPAKRGRGAKTK